MSVYLYTGEWDFLWEEAYTIMEAEKSHNMPSTSWRLRKARGIIQFDPEDMKTKRPLMLRSRVWRLESQELWCARAEEDSCPGSRRENLSFLHLFVLLELSVDWRMPTHIIEGGSLFSLSIQVLFSSEAPSQTIRENMFLLAIWSFFSPVKLTCKINHHKQLFGWDWSSVQHLHSVFPQISNVLPFDDFCEFVRRPKLSKIMN